MVCVALEPLTHQDLPKLEAGLQSLYQVSGVVGKWVGGWIERLSYDMI